MDLVSIRDHFLKKNVGKTSHNLSPAVSNSEHWMGGDEEGGINMDIWDKSFINMH